MDKKVNSTLKKMPVKGADQTKKFRQKRKHDLNLKILKVPE